MDVLTWLNNWYKNNCDGSWEHTYGIRLTTIDNPGWSLTVKLGETEQEGKLFSSNADQGDTDWFFIKSDGFTFNASGDPSKLTFLIEQFKVFVESEIEQ